jgi:hypothetical protein
VLPFFTGPKPRRRCAVVGNFTSVVSPGTSARGQALDRQHMPAGDSRAGQSAPAFDDLRRRHFRVGEKPTRLQFTTTVNTQPARGSVPEGRLQQTVLRATIRSRIAPPLYRGADPRMIQATIPSRLLFSGCQDKPNRTRVASGKEFLRSILSRTLLVRMP